MPGFALYPYLLYRCSTASHNRPYSVIAARRAARQSAFLRQTLPFPPSVLLHLHPIPTPSGEPALPQAAPGVHARTAPSLRKPGRRTAALPLRAMHLRPSSQFSQFAGDPPDSLAEHKRPLARPFICTETRGIPPLIHPPSGRPRRSDPRSPRCPACRCPAPDDSSAPRPTPVR